MQAFEALGKTLKKLLKRKPEKTKISLSEIRKVVHDFDGTQDVERWIRLVERTSTEQGWEEERAAKAAMLIKGEAFTYFEDNELDLKDWDDVKRAMIARFTTKQPRASVYAQLNLVKKGKRQDIRELADHIRKIARSSIEPIQESDLKLIFLRAMPDKFHVFMASMGDVGFEELVTLCHNMDVLTSSRTSGGLEVDDYSTTQPYRPTATNRVSHAYNQPTSSSASPQDTRSTTPKKACEICGKNNHKTEACFYGPDGKLAGKAPRPTARTPDNERSHTPTTGATHASDAKGRTKYQKAGTSDRACYLCGSLEHQMRDCPKKERLSAMLLEEEEEAASMRER